MEASSRKRLSLDTNLLSEINDALILAETVVAEIPIIVSSDKHLLGIDHDALHTVCVEADLMPVFPVNPRGLLRAVW